MATTAITDHNAEEKQAYAPQTHNDLVEEKPDVIHEETARAAAERGHVATDRYVLI
jgi:hypothetical protein